MAFPATLTREDDLFEHLSNVEASTVFDGGSARVLAIDPLGVEFDAYISLEGLWVNDPCNPGHVLNVKGWRIEYHY